MWKFLKQSVTSLPSELYLRVTGQACNLRSTPAKCLREFIWILGAEKNCFKVKVRYFQKSVWPHRQIAIYFGKSNRRLVKAPLLLKHLPCLPDIITGICSKNSSLLGLKIRTPLEVSFIGQWICVSCWEDLKFEERPYFGRTDLNWVLQEARGGTASSALGMSPWE